MDYNRANFAIAVAMVIILMAFRVTPSTPPPPGQGFEQCLLGFLSPQPHICNLYLSCEVGGYSLYQCPYNSVFSEIVGACVEFNSLFDHCTRNNPNRECAARHDGNVTLTIPHPSRCHQYFTCNPSQNDSFETHTCPYPDMFDMVERRCKPFKEAFCGPYRKEFKDACGDYLTWGCHRCPPCELSYPPCVGLPDGFSGHPWKLWSPYYILCDTERFINELTCSEWRDGVTRLFHRDRRECVTPWEIPREHGGYAPSCEGLTSGFHTEDRPDVYFHCPDETVYFCDAGWRFQDQLCSI